VNSNGISVAISMLIILRTEGKRKYQLGNKILIQHLLHPNFVQFQKIGCHVYKNVQKCTKMHKNAQIF
jgi:hypothetical protein